MSVAKRVRQGFLSIPLIALRRIPPRLRGPVVARLGRRLAPPEMRWGSSYSASWWDTFYEPTDPFHFDGNPREALKYERTLALCGPGPFERALELGCGEGAFTEILAPRCNELVAVDISDVAVQRAAARTQEYAGVSCERHTLPVDFPAGSFDLVVASDVLYYWQFPDLEAALPVLERALSPGGKLVVVHYRPPMGAILDGDEVHDLLAARLSLEHTHAEVAILDPAPYRFDVFERIVPEDVRGAEPADV